MSIQGIMSSSAQRRRLLSIWVILILALGAVIVAIFWSTAESRGWNVIINFLLAFETSAIFALLSTIFLSYYFTDPFDEERASVLLPEDIDGSLNALVQTGANYKIFVRTGRHFRASILPALVQRANLDRSPLRVEVILLDILDDVVCERYVEYRRTATFDKREWNLRYLRIEILATIICLAKAIQDSGGRVEIDLFLSKRLSTLRIDGTDNEIIVTREDPKDVAFRYRRQDRHFSAFVQDFRWIKQEAREVPKMRGNTSPIDTLRDVFGDIPLIKELIGEAVAATSKGTPYAR